MNILGFSESFATLPSTIAPALQGQTEASFVAALQAALPGLPEPKSEGQEAAECVLATLRQQVAAPPIFAASPALPECPPEVAKSPTPERPNFTPPVPRKTPRQSEPDTALGEAPLFYFYQNDPTEPQDGSEADAAGAAPLCSNAVELEPERPPHEVQVSAEGFESEIKTQQPLSRETKDVAPQGGPALKTEVDLLPQEKKATAVMPGQGRPRLGAEVDLLPQEKKATTVMPGQGRPRLEAEVDLLPQEKKATAVVPSQGRPRLEAEVDLRLPQAKKTTEVSDNGRPQLDFGSPEPLKQSKKPAASVPEQGTQETAAAVTGLRRLRRVVGVTGERKSAALEQPETKVVTAAVEAQQSFPKVAPPVLEVPDNPAELSLKLERGVGKLQAATPPLAQNAETVVTQKNPEYSLLETLAAVPIISGKAPKMLAAGIRRDLEEVEMPAETMATETEPVTPAIAMAAQVEATDAPQIPDRAKKFTANSETESEPLKGPSAPRSRSMSRSPILPKIAELQEPEGKASVQIGPLYPAPNFLNPTPEATSTRPAQRLQARTSPELSAPPAESSSKRAFPKSDTIIFPGIGQGDAPALEASSDLPTLLKKLQIRELSNPEAQPEIRQRPMLAELMQRIQGASAPVLNLPKAPADAPTKQVVEPLLSLLAEKKLQFESDSETDTDTPPEAPNPLPTLLPQEPKSAADPEAAEPVIAANLPDQVEHNQRLARQQGQALKEKPRELELQLHSERLGEVAARLKVEAGGHWTAHVQLRDAQVEQSVRQELHQLQETRGLDGFTTSLSQDDRDQRGAFQGFSFEQQQPRGQAGILQKKSLAPSTSVDPLPIARVSSVHGSSRLNIRA